MVLKSSSKNTKKEHFFYVEHGQLFFCMKNFSSYLILPNQFFISKKSFFRSWQDYFRSVNPMKCIWFTPNNLLDLSRLLQSVDPCATCYLHLIFYTLERIGLGSAYLKFQQYKLTFSNFITWETPYSSVEWIIFVALTVYSQVFEMRIRPNPSISS